MDSQDSQGKVPTSCCVCLANSQLALHFFELELSEVMDMCDQSNGQAGHCHRYKHNTRGTIILWMLTG